MNSQIHLVGLNHRTAGVEVRERFALSAPDCQEKGLFPPDSPVQENLILSTCNRVEVLAVGETPDLDALVLEHWAGARGLAGRDLAPYVYRHQGREAVEHLFSVAASLDSMVLGEPQILGQLKDAYKKSLERGSTRVILNRLLHKAFSVAKRVRSETGVASSAVSISYAAVELARRIFGDMSAYRALLIGAGEMAELAATHLMNAGIKSVWVANRTYARAVELAACYNNGEAVPFENLLDRLHEVDIVISSTGAPDSIITAADMRPVLKRRKNRPMFFIDIAVPRDIDPDVNGLDNIYLYDIDDLKEVVEENMAQRRDEAAKARLIVDEEAVKFMSWLDSLDLQPTIVDMLGRSERIAQEELARTLKRIGPVNQDTEDALRAMLNSVVKKLNHDPIVFLKRHLGEDQTGRQRVGLIRRVFNLDQDYLDEDNRCPGKKDL